MFVVGLIATFIFAFFMVLILFDVNSLYAFHDIFARFFQKKNEKKRRNCQNEMRYYPIGHQRRVYTLYDNGNRYNRVCSESHKKDMGFSTGNIALEIDPWEHISLEMERFERRSPVFDPAKVNNHNGFGGFSYAFIKKDDVKKELDSNDNKQNPHKINDDEKKKHQIINNKYKRTDDNETKYNHDDFKRNKYDNDGSKQNKYDDNFKLNKYDKDGSKQNKTDKDDFKPNKYDHNNSKQKKNGDNFTKKIDIDSRKQKEINANDDKQIKDVKTSKFDRGNFKKENKYNKKRQSKSEDDIKNEDLGINKKGKNNRDNNDKIKSGK